MDFEDALFFLSKLGYSSAWLKSSNHDWQAWKHLDNRDISSLLYWISLDSYFLYKFKHLFVLFSCM